MSLATLNLPLIEENHMHPLRVLIVDDQRAYRDYCKEIITEFEDFEYDILEASTADEGCTLYGRYKPDCIIIDLNLNDSTGLEVLERISDEDKENKSVIFMTGLTRSAEDSKLSRDIIDKGARHYFSKEEITPELLHEAITEAVQLRSENGNKGEA